MWILTYRPHRCPEPRSLRAPPTNFTMRYAKRPYNVPFTGLEGSSNNRKFIYSRYRPTQTFRPSEDDDIFLCCEFSVSITYPFSVYIVWKLYCMIIFMVNIKELHKCIYFARLIKFILFIHIKRNKLKVLQDTVKPGT